MRRRTATLKSGRSASKPAPARRANVSTDLAILESRALAMLRDRGIVDVRPPVSAADLIAVEDALTALYFATTAPDRFDAEGRWKDPIRDDWRKKYRAAETCLNTLQACAAYRAAIADNDAERAAPFLIRAFSAFMPAAVAREGERKLKVDGGRAGTTRERDEKMARAFLRLRAEMKSESPPPQDTLLKDKVAVDPEFGLEPGPGQSGRKAIDRGLRYLRGMRAR